VDNGIRCGLVLDLRMMLGLKGVILFREERHVEGLGFWPDKLL
jgi:hypothetical protein